MTKINKTKNYRIDFWHKDGVIYKTPSKKRLVKIGYFYLDGVLRNSDNKWEKVDCLIKIQNLPR